MKYNLFVSYRRSSFESANLIAEKMRSMGYSVFFDVETLRAGNFNEQLFDVIDNCNDFILVLPPNALDKCNNEEDWVRREVLRAMASNKNIIPVMLSGFSWPEPMPQGMENLANYQAIIAGEQEFFDMSMKRLAGYLKSKPNRDLRKFYKKMFIALSCVILIVGLSTAVIFQAAKSLCDNVAMNLTGCMGSMHLLYNESTNISNAWNEFVDDYSRAENSIEANKVIGQFTKELDSINKMVSFCQGQLVHLSEFSSVQEYLLGLYNVKSHEILALYKIFDALFYELTVQDIEYITSIVSDKEKMNDSRFVEYYTIHVPKGIEIFKAYLDATFCAYSELMSRLPKSAQEHYNKQRPGWTNYPNLMSLKFSAEDLQVHEDAAKLKAEKAIMEMEKAAERLKGKITTKN